MAVTRALALALALLAVVIAPRAGAQSEKAAAEALFNEGRKLMDAKDFAAACEKFKRSNEIDPAVGTLLNLGECYEQSRKLASAWESYKEAENLAVRTGDKRARGAAARAADVEPKVSRLTVSVAKEARVEGLALAIDGIALKSALWGTAAPIDAGHHLVTAKAPGKREWKKELQIGEGESASVTVPALSPDAEGGGAVGAPARGEPKPVGKPPADVPADEKSSGLGAQRTWALVAGGVGVVGIGVGTFLALGAKSKFDDAKAHCRDGTSQCDADAESMSSDARSQGNLATIAWGVGLAGLATGAVLWLTAPKTKERSTASRAPRVAAIPQIGRGEAALFVSGTFR